MILRIVLFLTLFLQVALSLQAKEYTIRSVETDVIIHEDGRVSFTEYRRYSFEGSFTWADYRLNTTEFGEISDFSIHEVNKDYTRGEGEQAGTYQINRDDDVIQLKWFFDARDTTRTFIITYTLSGVIETGENWALLDWYYLSDDWGKTTEYFTVSAGFENDEQVYSELLYAWLYSDAQVQMDTDNGTLSLLAEQVSRRDDIRVRFLFPKSLIPMAPVSSPDLTKESVIDEENRRLEQIEQEKITREKRKAFADVAIPVVTGVSVVLFIFFFRKYRPEKSAEEIPLKPSDDGFPTQHKPALIARLIHGGYTGGNVVMATLLDLSRRGVITLRHTGKEKKVFSEVDVVEIAVNEPVEMPLEDFEHSLLEFIKSRMEEENAQDLYSIFNGKTMKVHSWKTEWTKKIKKQVDGLNWYDERSKKGAVYNAIFQLLLSLCAAVLVFWSMPDGLISLFTTMFAALGSLGIFRKTPKGKAVFDAWQEVKKHLNKDPEKASELYEPMGVLIHGVNLGINKEKLKKVIAVYNIDKEEVFNKVLEVASSYSNEEEWMTTLMVSSYGVTVMPIAGSGAGATAGSAAAGASGGAAGGAG